MLESIPKDLNQPWKDPMLEIGDRHITQELRGVGIYASNMPDWKKDTFSKAPTLGQWSNLSILEHTKRMTTKY
jgi:ATP-dependent RNA helicase DHX8/PRP22